MMGKAILTYNDHTKSTTLTSGSLFEIDTYCQNFPDETTLLESFQSKIGSDIAMDGKIQLSYIRNNSRKENLELLLADPEPITFYDDYSAASFSEIEQARKLLFHSKNHWFIHNFLNDSKLSYTLQSFLPISSAQCRVLQKENIQYLATEEGGKVLIRDLFVFAQSHSKLGRLRPVFENSLDYWKKEIQSYPDEGVYYFSRNLRLLRNRYGKMVNRKEGIKNLKIHEKFTSIVLDNHYSKHLVKVKELQKSF